MRWRWDEDSTAYRCCFCMHVNTGSVMLGMFHMTFNLLAILMLIGALFVNPTAVENSTESSEAVIDPNVSPDGMVTQYHHRKWNNDDKLLAVLMHLCSFLIASLLVSGVKKGNPNYLIPFFFMQLFDFVLSLTAGFAFLSYPRDIKVWLAAQQDLPYRDQLLATNTDQLLFGIFVAFVIVLSIKYYLMSMVWSSYKFLEQQRRQELNASRSDAQDEDGCEDSEVVAMVGPPKYEDAFVANENIVKLPPPPAYTA